MKRTETLILFLAALVLSGLNELSAQEIVVPEGYELVDSIVYRPASAVDTSLVGKDIFKLMPKKSEGGAADVEIFQSDSLMNAMQKHVAANSGRTLSGYRVRIFFDNRQSARVASEETLKRFESLYHDVVGYQLGIFQRTRINNFTICMQIQKKSNIQDNLEKEEWNWRNQPA